MFQTNSTNLDRYINILELDTSQEGIKVERDYELGSMKSQMRKANKSNCRFTLIIGENEVKSGKYTLKNMRNGEQQEVQANNLSAELEKQIETNN